MTQDIQGEDDMSLRATSSATRIATTIPPSSTSPGQRGDMVFDTGNGWVYFCYAPNLWTRAAIGSF